MPVGSIQGIYPNPGLQPPKVVKPSSALTYYDPKDTNQDGIVSAAESLAYSLKHPEWDPVKSANADLTKAATTTHPAYTAKGAQKQTSRSVLGILDLKG